MAVERTRLLLLIVASLAFYAQTERLKLNYMRRCLRPMLVHPDFVQQQ